MLQRLLLAAALAVGLSSHGWAQNAQGQRVTLVDERGVPIGAANPLASGAAAIAIVPVTATGTALVAKGSAASLLGFSLTQGATAGFFAFLNTATAPAANAAIAPLECVPVAANGYVARRQDMTLDRYTAGLVIVSTSSCTTFTAVTPVLISALVQ